jgi:NAD(P)-dependent dehydrogenase (short-subunit alcohol dehydrogenase family)
MRRSDGTAGANKGLGYELCRILLEDKHPVIAACRTQEKGTQ